MGLVANVEGSREVVGSAAPRDEDPLLQQVLTMSPQHPLQERGTAFRGSDVEEYSLRHVAKARARHYSPGVQDSRDTAATDGADRPRVAVITTVRDEADLLPVWLGYYGPRLGYDNLIVLDDNTVDGSTDDLPCVRYRLPPGPWKADWGRTRMRLVNGLASSLLAVNDVVIYTDVDELLIPDPAHHRGLLDYLGTRADTDVVAPFAVEVIHHPDSEPPLDLSRPILHQRSFAKFSPAMCKPLIRRSDSRWRKAFHANVAPFSVDPELWMFHLKFVDETVLRRTARARESYHRVEGRGHPRSFWSMSEEEIVSKLTDWTRAATDPGELDPYSLDLDDLVQLDEAGTYQATANQVASLEESPLRRIPERFRDAV